MFQIGESVVYGTTGVCKVVSIGPISMRGIDRHKQYYTLEPIHQGGAVYVPAVEDNKLMRMPMTRKDAEALLERIPSIEIGTIATLNYKQRTETFSAMLSSTNPDELVQMIKAINAKKRGAKEKQRYNIDNNYLKRATNLLCGELSFVFECGFDEIREKVESLVATEE